MSADAHYQGQCVIYKNNIRLLELRIANPGNLANEFALRNKIVNETKLSAMNAKYEGFKAAKIAKVAKTADRMAAKSDKEAAKAEKKAAKELAKAEKKAAKDVVAAETNALRAENKAIRELRRAEKESIRANAETEEADKSVEVTTYEQSIQYKSYAVSVSDNSDEEKEEMTHADVSSYAWTSGW